MNEQVKQDAKYFASTNPSHEEWITWIVQNVDRLTHKAALQEALDKLPKYYQPLPKDLEDDTNRHLYSYRRGWSDSLTKVRFLLTSLL